MKIEVTSVDAMKQFGQKIGQLLTGGEVIELRGDIGAGKTTLTKGIAAGFGVDEDVQSPTFTISRVYDARDDLRLSHYDFYRLRDAGIMTSELEESISDSQTVTIIEWAEIVRGVLPPDTLTISIVSPTEATRQVEITAGGAKSQSLLERLA